MFPRNKYKQNHNLKGPVGTGETSYNQNILEDMCLTFTYPQWHRVTKCHKVYLHVRLKSSLELL